MEEEKVTVTEDQLAEDQKALALVPTFGSLQDLAQRPASEKIAALKSVTSYVGAETVSIDDYLGVILEVVGYVKHPATVKGQDGAEQEVERVVFKLSDGKCLGFVSKAAVDFVDNYLNPLFGMGDFIEDGQPVAVPIMVRQIRTRQGYRTYSFQVK
ncbi:MAG: hypothetical protein IRZ03_16410 [Acidobacterium ailaaui]|nr:hypothetical protein [Pseudacidobacterium ailaaui]